MIQTTATASLTYAITLTPDDNGTFLVSVPELPWVHTYGATETIARAMAAHAIATALAYAIDKEKGQR
jgi:antitoxin HicB